jgi:Spy/CpxP family protein refolding chaperone
VERLKLTDVQCKEFEEIFMQHRENLIDLRANLQKTELALEPLVRDAQPNETKILAQIDKVAQARAELEKANAAYLLAIRGKLTTEQWAQVQAERANRAREGWNGKDRGQGTGGVGMGNHGMYYRRAHPSHPAAPQGDAPSAPAAPSAPPVPQSEFE